MVERPDCKNVNNWHWVEKNATPWSKDRLTDLLIGREIEKGSVKVLLKEFKKIEGDATANNRKAKLIFLFDWVLEVKFVAHVAGSELEYNGVLEIPNLSDENEADEVDLNVTIETKGPHEAELRHILNKEGLQFIRSQLGVYIKELKQEFSKGLILDTVTKPQTIVKSGTTRVVDKSAFQNTVVTGNEPDAKPTAPVTVTSFDLAEGFKVPPEKLYEFLTEPDMVKVWTNGNAVVEAKEGGSFALYNGQITGKYTKVEKNKLLESDWRLRDYPPGHYAKITFSLEDQGDSTLLKVQAEKVPQDKADTTREGFYRFYMQSIGRTFGCGMRMF
ncbi:unnamed protein product [Bursaphelenchus okinawaensis]|uniref:Activator of Hsp90 ATPase AHSA1-like N-terminal domain-containing protein n=1 Tax=Bursaphelenchus okinawaensis TaxID=465554 RepID=A0A811L948_9BILA|nr:unnamed protein product [Bursaphelenchus okinawaensis]CAG9120262.1 unnamed protein product [Bursaphelenchus okinawaensis]